MKYYNIKDRADKFRPINIIIGGRGIGKTYSTLDYVIQEDKPFLYLRNTDIQISESAGTFGNPFKRLNIDKGYDYMLSRSGKHYVIKSGGEIKGYGAALSTFANLRGVDLSEIKYVVFDEFIELKRLAYDQFRAFMGLYETINRNRELQGELPLICFLLSNSQKIDNDILGGFGLIEKIMQMIKAGQENFYTDEMWLSLPKSEVSEAKRKTAIYKLSEKTDIYKEALNNAFAYDNFENIKKEKLSEYNPLCGYDDIYIYRHKTNGRIYISQKPHNKRLYGGKDDKLLFMRSYGMALMQHRQQNNITYESYSARRGFEDVLNS